MILGSRNMRSEGLEMPWVWIQGCRDPETMRACRPYALHTMECVVGIQTTMDTITIRYIL